MSNMMEQYKRVQEINAKMRASIDHCELIKRGALIKLQNEHERNDKLYFAQIALIYDQIDEAMDIERMTLDRAMKIEQLSNTAEFLTTQWKNKAQYLHAEMDRIIKA
nr:MAG TPA: hypothetical protein [Caudoviricetes sp.]